MKVQSTEAGSQAANPLELKSEWIISSSQSKNISSKKIRITKKASKPAVNDEVN